MSLESISTPNRMTTEQPAPNNPFISRTQVETHLREALMDRGVANLGSLPPQENTGSPSPLEHRLVKAAILPEPEILDILSAFTGLPRLNLAESPIDTAVVDIVPPALVASSNIMPLRFDEESVVMAIDHVPDVADEDRLRLLLERNVQFELGEQAEIHECIVHYYGMGLRSFLGMSTASAINPQKATDSSQRTDIQAFIQEVIQEAINASATDIHVEPYEGELCIRFRIDGSLYPMHLPPGIETYNRQIVSGLKVLAQLDMAERRQPQDGRFQGVYGDQRFDFRVSVLPSRHGEALNLRILNRAATFLPLEKLGIHASQRLLFETLLDSTHGIVLFTGPTGSGKSTSLYAALSSLNRDDQKIITLEDPVEYEIRGITQLQVNSAIDFTFAAGLRSILRHDPDVVLVGEIRDSETAEIVTSASLTGHLVFSTLHTNDAVSTIPRLIDMGVEPYLVASSLRGVVAQRLVRRLCPACKKPVTARATPNHKLHGLFQEMETSQRVYQAEGCPQCLFTGHRGRLALFEILPINAKLSSLAAAKNPSGVLQKQALQDGLVTILESGWKFVRDGIISIEEVLRVTQTSQE